VLVSFALHSGAKFRPKSFFGGVPSLERMRPSRTFIKGHTRCFTSLIGEIFTAIRRGSGA